MIQDFSNKLLWQLADEIGRVTAQEVSPFHRLKMVSKLVRTALEKLRLGIEEPNTLIRSEEIHFFNDIKRAFYKWWIFHSELYLIE